MYRRAHWGHRVAWCRSMVEGACLYLNLLRRNLGEHVTVGMVSKGVSLVFCFVFETGSYYVVLASLRLSV